MTEKVDLQFNVTGNAEKELKKTGKEGKKALEKISKSSKKASKSMSGFSATAKKAGVAIGAFMGLATAKKVFDFVKSVNANRDAMLNLSNATGVTVKDLSELQYAAELNKTSFTAVEASLKKMVMTVGMAEQGSKTAKDAFSGLGIELKKSDGTLKSVNDLFEESVEALSNVENKTERLTKAQLIFGRGATELGSIIDGGADSLRKAKDEAESLGVAFDRLDAEQSARFNDEMLRLESRASGLAMTLSTSLTPALADLIEGWNSLLNGKSSDEFLEKQSDFGVQWAKANGTLKQTIALQEQLSNIINSTTQNGSFLGSNVTAGQAGDLLMQYEDIEDQERAEIQRLKEISKQQGFITNEVRNRKKINNEPTKSISSSIDSKSKEKGLSDADVFSGTLKSESDRIAKEMADMRARTAEEKKIQSELETEIKEKAIADQQEETQNYIDNADIRIAKAKEEGEARIKQNELMSDSYATMANSLIDAAQRGMSASKASANAQKAVAIGQIQMNAAVGMMKVWADPGYPAAIPLTIAIGAQSTSSSALVASQSFEKSGVVGGSSYTGDRNAVNANTGEMFIDRYKQKNLFDMISGGSGGGGSTINVNFSNNVGLDTGKIVSVIQSAVQRGSKTNRPIGMGA